MGRVLLGVSGGIAAYKAAALARALVREEVEVDTILTPNAARFVSPLTFSSLTGRSCLVEQFTEGTEADYRHLELPADADLFLVVPATANLIGKLASGIADNLLLTSLLAADSPVLIAPAMNTRMWNNPIVQQNIEKLKGRGYAFVEPVSGLLACGDIGSGKLAPIESILERSLGLLNRSSELAGVNILITAGATQEAIDPVRFISNPSTGKMGFALAEAARLRGATVALVAGPTSLTPPEGVRYSAVTSALDMLEAVERSYSDCHVFISAAAVSDLTPLHPATEKLKKTGLETTIRFRPTPDILKMMGEKKGERVHVGFALESENLLANATEKLRRKRLDLIVANDLTVEGAGFAVDTNVATILGSDGTVEKLSKMSKRALAGRILDQIVLRINQRGALQNALLDDALE